jgi:hypothetical protein
MTTLQITLPDQLVQEAQRAGLVSSDTIERLLRVQLKTRHLGELFKAIDQIAAVNIPAAMSPEEVAEKIRAMRTQRNSRNPN